jgi:hypothetical protein
MLLTSTNINPLPFYTSLDEKWQHRRYADKHDIFCPTDRIIPFQLIVGEHTQYACRVWLYDAITNTEVKQLVLNTDYTQNRKKYTGYQVVAISDIASDGLMEAGKYYYLKFAVEYPGGTLYDVYYSDDFQANSRTGEMCRLDYYNERDMAIGDYTIFGGSSKKRFVFRYYIPHELGKPEYPFYTRISERNNIEYPLTMRSQKKFRVPITATEVQIDALRLSVVSDKVALTCNGKTYKIWMIEWTEVEWRGDGIGVFDCLFTTNEILNNSFQAAPTRGDFNDDFNDDFSI